MESAETERGQPEGHQESKNRAKQGENPDRKKNALAADAESRESDDFAVHRHAAEAEQDTDEHRHGDGENENAGDDVEEEVYDLKAGARVTNEKLHEANQLGNEKDEGEDDQAEEGVADDFTHDVTIKDAHVAKGECNMGKSVTRKDVPGGQ